MTKHSTVTDLELLELAAKAASIHKNTDCLVPYFVNELGLRWNPLNNDGDAFRLAVALNLTVRVGKVTSKETGSFSAGLLRIKQDPCAATRRAITIAAAAIGKEMK